VFSYINEFLGKRNKLEIIFIGTVLIILLGILDYASGYELSFSIFYLAPVSIASWYIGKYTGIIISVFSAIVWLIVDYASGHQYSSKLYIFWNASVRMCFFIITSYLLFKIKTDLNNKESQSRLDSLTGIMNLRAFEESYNKIVKLSSRNNNPLSIGYVDIDDFKNVNDSLGHSEGDLLLKEFAKVLSATLRESDFICRLGGDEFAVMLPETDYEGSRKLFDKLNLRLLELTKNTHAKFGVSIGVGIFHNSLPSLREALKYTDDLMYNVKKSGKNDAIYKIYD